MPGIFERITSLSGTEFAKATNLAHQTYQTRMATHGHTGRALVETVAHVCRNHPGLVGIGVGLLVEHLLAEDKKHYDKTHLTDGTPIPGADPKAAAPLAPPIDPTNPHHGLHLPFKEIHLANLRPGHVAWEVFGGILLLKVAATGVRMFRHKHQGQPWFSHAAKVHLFSGALGAYYLTKSLKAPRPSAWRNAAAALFLTDALKPVFRPDKNWRAAADQVVPAQPAQVAQVVSIAPVAPAPAAANQTAAAFEPQTPAERARAAAMYAAQNPSDQPLSFEGHGAVVAPVNVGPAPVETAPPPPPTYTDAPLSH
jgi:hypothetical protein